MIVCINGTCKGMSNFGPILHHTLILHQDILLFIAAMLWYYLFVFIMVIITDLGQRQKSA